MTYWADLQLELDRWAQQGRRAEFWWRDDDAISPTPELERLLSLSQEHQVPLVLAVIPARATIELADHLVDHKLVATVQHGCRHTNHAPQGEKSAEFGPHRPLEQMLREVDEGRDLIKHFPRPVPIFVPPWNRIADELIATLPGIGITALSTFGARSTARPGPGLAQINTHVDPIAWREHRGFVGTKTVLGSIVDHLGKRRTGALDESEPTGLLTHHLVHDTACWRFIDQLFKLTCAHEAVSWLDVDQIVRSTRPCNSPGS